MAVISWLLQLFHGMKVGYFVMIYLNKRFGLRYTDFLEYVIQVGPECPTIYAEIQSFKKRIEDIHGGAGRGTVLSEFGDIYWDEEEAGFLRVALRKNFYSELFEVVYRFLNMNDKRYSADELSEVLIYQGVRVPSLKHTPTHPIKFNHNIPEYFDKLLTKHPVELTPTPQTMTLEAKDYKGDKKLYARNTILRGRKSGKILVPVLNTP